MTSLTIPISINASRVVKCIYNQPKVPKVGRHLDIFCLISNSTKVLHMVFIVQIHGIMLLFFASLRRQGRSPSLQAASSSTRLRDCSKLRRHRDISPGPGIWGQTWSYTFSSSSSRLPRPALFLPSVTEIPSWYVHHLVFLEQLACAVWRRRLELLLPLIDSSHCSLSGLVHQAVKCQTRFAPSLSWTVHGLSMELCRASWIQPKRYAGGQNVMQGTTEKVKMMLLQTF